MQLRQTAGLAVPLVMASVLLAACSSSGSRLDGTVGRVVLVGSARRARPG